RGAAGPDRLGRRGRPAAPRPARSAGGRQPRSAALPQLVGYPVPRLHRRSARPRAARLHPATALGALSGRRDPPMSLHDELSRYLEHLRSERQLSPHSLAGYQRDLDKVRTFCEEQRLTHWADLDSGQLRQLIARLHRQCLSGRSLSRLLSALRGLYAWLNRQGLSSHDPCSGLSAPKGERRLPRTLDADRAVQLLDGGVEDDFIARRDQAMLELFYSSGLRLSELVRLA